MLSETLELCMLLLFVQHIFWTQANFEDNKAFRVTLGSFLFFLFVLLWTVDK